MIWLHGCERKDLENKNQDTEPERIPLEALNTAAELNEIIKEQSVPADLTSCWISLWGGVRSGVLEIAEGVQGLARTGQNAFAMRIHIQSCSHLQGCWHSLPEPGRVREASATDVPNLLLDVSFQIWLSHEMQIPFPLHPHPTPQPLPPTPFRLLTAETHSFPVIPAGAVCVLCLIDNLSVQGQIEC